ncbi:shikimate dehydrogenase [Acidaminobacter hydrogenoformans]|uniref:Shikimate dehydrogenase (NADP(+)) n=1 Tax=Acidaminobacter hydrogenoformans DSM 2784 TaxID=1120920 RepID=A0A1G5S035_9FIRM|nr:shikimate dehydrogenase [Acidaminobacter hydrogenoformans]SCZ79340.1 shikimate dehydrogenase [Acidaminobacter hydrogenoformans DSM 2784]
MIKCIDGRYRLTGLLGYPLKNSRSPRMHNISFSALGLEYAYLAFEIEDGFLPGALEAMKALHAQGFNVTMPHKQKVLQYLDEVDPAARMIGAVNTVYNDNGRLVGYNTDGKGFVKGLAEEGFDLAGKRVVLVGAGGAGRAVGVQVALSGITDMTIFDVESEKVTELLETIHENIKSVNAIGVVYNEAAVVEAVKNADLLIDCTPLGMDKVVTNAEGQEENLIDKSTVNDPSVFRPDLFVAHIVYIPLETKLIKMAKDAGCKTMNGIPMMIWQGAEAFEIWTGHQMPVDVVKKDLFGE